MSKLIGKRKKEETSESDEDDHHLDNDELESDYDGQSEEEEDEEDDEEEDEEDDEEDDDDEDEEDNNGAKRKLTPSKKEAKKLKDQETISNLKNTIKQELSQMTFEEIVKYQNKLGLKKFKEVTSQDNSSTQPENPNDKTFKRLNKNRPQELTSKKPVSVFRNLFQVKKKEEPIDPRFNSAFGEYKPEFFRKRYSFINDLRIKEKEMLSEQIKSETDPRKKDQIKSSLTRLKQQIKSYEESEKKEATKEKIKKQTMEDAKEGKRPHFVNKSEQKILELAEKYKELKKSGKIETFLAKKRKKALGKDHKHLNKNNEHLRFK